MCKLPNNIVAPMRWARGLRMKLSRSPADVVHFLSDRLVSLLHVATRQLILRKCTSPKTAVLNRQESLMTESPRGIDHSLGVVEQVHKLHHRIEVFLLLLKLLRGLKMMRRRIHSVEQGPLLLCQAWRPCIARPGKHVGGEDVALSPCLFHPRHDDSTGAVGQLAALEVRAIALLKQRGNDSNSPSHIVVISHVLVCSDDEGRAEQRSKENGKLAWERRADKLLSMVWHCSMSPGSLPRVS
mmetsp:Transcript_26353/g.59879  ORF Transcript_26353/g.59879 Transcript_26353/m.59879 type:complete len:241 (+) Transcript_26353:414-1136(+)